MNEEEFILTLNSIGMWEEVDTYTDPRKVNYIQALLLENGIISVIVGRTSIRKRVIVIAVPVANVPKAKRIAGVQEHQGDDFGAYSWYED